MSDARHALLSAVYGALAADTVLMGMISGVFDRAPRGVAHPFVAFGPHASRPLDGDAPATVEHRFEVVVHSREAGRGEASAVAERVRAVLDGATLELMGQRLVSLGWRDTDGAATRDLSATRVRLRFRALTEAA